MTGTRSSGYSSGAAYAFFRSSGVWSQQAYLKASNTGNNDAFGASAALNDDLIVIGAPKRTAALPAWMGIGSGGRFVVGAQLEDSSATGTNGDGSDNGAGNSGALYVFKP